MGEKLVSLHLKTVDFSCDNSILNVRTLKRSVIKQDLGSGQMEMVYQTERDVYNGSLRLEAVAVTFSFQAPRRSCRVNIESEAVAISSKLFLRADIFKCSL